MQDCRILTGEGIAQLEYIAPPLNTWISLALIMSYIEWLSLNYCNW